MIYNRPMFKYLLICNNQEILIHFYKITAAIKKLVITVHFPMHARIKLTLT
jgi:hypothetical protein